MGVIDGIFMVRWWGGGLSCGRFRKFFFIMVKGRGFVRIWVGGSFLHT